MKMPSKVNATIVNGTVKPLTVLSFVSESTEAPLEEEEGIYDQQGDDASSSDGKQREG